MEHKYASMLAIKLEPEQRAIISAASKAECLTQSGFARRHLMIAAKKVLADAAKETANPKQP